MEKQLPPGDGHPVVIFPGLAADRLSTAPLKDFCEDLGYAAYDWGRGFNTGPQGDVDAWLDGLAQHVRELTCGAAAEGEPHRLEPRGHLRPRDRQEASRARAPGHHDRDAVRRTTEQTNAAWVYRLLNGQTPLLDEALMARLRTAPDVPTDLDLQPQRRRRRVAVVHPGRRPRAHREHRGRRQPLSAGLESEVLSVIADRLRPSGRWRACPQSTTNLRQLAPKEQTK